MNLLVRRVLAVVLGMILAGLVVQAVEALGNRMYPLPEGTDLADIASMKQAIRSLPAGAFLMVLAAWVIGAFVGAFLASQISGRTSKWPGVTVGLLVLTGSVITMLALPHPAWTWAAAVVLVPAAGLAASLFAMRHPGDVHPL